MSPKAAVIALSHGGGPMPLLGDPKHANLVESLKTRVPAALHLDDPVRRPRAIALVTAHWEESTVTISAAKKHDLYYDYRGFPAESYKLKYDAPGSPEVAEEIRQVLESEGVTCAMDTERGWDHGVFVPMTLVRPAADIPIVQLSILSSQDAAQHFRYGQALASLRERNIAIVASGFASFHNIRLLFGGASDNTDFKELYGKWSDTMAEAVHKTNVEERGEALTKWRDWPGAWSMHPRGGADHFMPLVVAAGAAGQAEVKGYEDEFMGLGYWSYYWDE